MLVGDRVKVSQALKLLKPLKPTDTRNHRNPQNTKKLYQSNFVTLKTFKQWKPSKRCNKLNSNHQRTRITLNALSTHLDTGGWGSNTAKIHETMEIVQRPETL